MKWLPIHTAPKDGTDVLVYYAFATVPIVHIAFYREVDENLMRLGWKGDESGWWSYIENSVSQHKLEGFNSPTHWMRLPDHPK